MSKEKRVLTKGEKNLIKIMTIAIVAVFAVFAWLMYANDYYRATTEAKKIVWDGTEKVTVTEKEDYYIFDMPEEDATKGIVFYSGAKVEEISYAPMLAKLAEEGYEVYLVKLPAKLAMFGLNTAEDVFESAPHIEEWTMMGHSFGGAMAASFCESHDEEVDALVLLAAYSTVDLSDKEIEVYSFYGSEDKVLNMENYEKYRENLPEDFTEQVIEGGNHANFGHYGAQDGDGEASITRAEQLECVLDIFLSLQQ